MESVVRFCSLVLAADLVTPAFNNPPVLALRAATSKEAEETGRRE